MKSLRWLFLLNLVLPLTQQCPNKCCYYYARIPHSVTLNCNHNRGTFRFQNFCAFVAPNDTVGRIRIKWYWSPSPSLARVRGRLLESEDLNVTVVEDGPYKGLAVFPSVLRIPNFTPQNNGFYWCQPEGELGDTCIQPSPEAHLRLMFNNRARIICKSSNYTDGFVPICAQCPPEPVPWFVSLTVGTVWVLVLVAIGIHKRNIFLLFLVCAVSCVCVLVCLLAISLPLCVRCVRWRKRKRRERRRRRAERARSRDAGTTDSSNVIPNTTSTDSRMQKTKDTVKPKPAQPQPTTRNTSHPLSHPPTSALAPTDGSKGASNFTPVSPNKKLATPDSPPFAASPQTSRKLEVAETSFYQPVPNKPALNTSTASQTAGHRSVLYIPTLVLHEPSSIDGNIQPPDYDTVMESAGGEKVSCAAAALKDIFSPEREERATGADAGATDSRNTIDTTACTDFRNSDTVKLKPAQPQLTTHGSSHPLSPPPTSALAPTDGSKGASNFTPISPNKKLATPDSQSFAANPQTSRKLEVTETSFNQPVPNKPALNTSTASASATGIEKLNLLSQTAGHRSGIPTLVLHEPSSIDENIQPPDYDTVMESAGGEKVNLASHAAAEDPDMFSPEREEKATGADAGTTDCGNIIGCTDFPNLGAVKPKPNQPQDDSSHPLSPSPILALALTDGSQGASNLTPVSPKKELATPDRPASPKNSRELEVAETSFNQPGVDKSSAGTKMSQTASVCHEPVASGTNAPASGLEEHNCNAHGQPPDNWTVTVTFSKR